MVVVEEGEVAAHVGAGGRSREKIGVAHETIPRCFHELFIGIETGAFCASRVIGDKFCDNLEIGG